MQKVYVWYLSNKNKHLTQQGVLSASSKKEAITYLSKSLQIEIDLHYLEIKELK